MYYYEYRDREWEMWLEGTSDTKPDTSVLIKHAEEKGFKLENITFWVDSLQKCWVSGWWSLMKFFGLKIM